ncbi:hypothetical protein [Aurantiacibacter sediminis]|uniref:Uncharacterized protein n=1 Tax=Aurantiacibacter sediminis TaxID=2793064 RepID=A0ABS0N4S7_9SPHN|nr:hypothetical protein [Aurantiacibacter sediminis]MBH5322454.1 hypothetical protein [Aurantiacibacter sediminis]
MKDQEALAELAIARTRAALSGSKSFQSLDVAEQKQLFGEMYRSNYAQLAEATGTPERPVRPRRMSRAQAASDDIDDDRHLNTRIDQTGDLAGDFIGQVDFPGFVRDLLKGVFDANLEVTLAQMNSYQELLQTATASVSKFVNAIDDTAAFGYLAENNSDEFSIDFGDGSGTGGEGEAQLTGPTGEPLDIGDNEVKARIMDAKIAMAKEQRALLRETILMGITRLVVEKGNVKASVLFDIKSTEEVVKRDKAAQKDTYTSGRSGRMSTGLIGKLVGGGGVGRSSSRRKSKISISTVDSKATTELAAKVAGSVDITFKSDYFKLDNFATMYGPEAGGAQAPQGSNAGAGGQSGGQ